MAKESGMKLGPYVFLAGVVLALFVGLATGFMPSLLSNMALISGVMFVLGLVAGAMNVTDKEVVNFIIAALGLAMGAAALANLGTVLMLVPATLVVGTIIQSAFVVFGIFVAGSVFIPAVKAVYQMAKD